MNRSIKVLTISVFTSFIFCFLIGAAAQAKSRNDSALLEFNSIVFPQVAQAGMVASQEARATQVGVNILEQGGNAVDAAVAVGFALAVTLPRAGNIGGGGFMMIYDQQAKQVNALDYREKAPLLANKNMFIGSNGEVANHRARFSHLSSGVPGTVAGLVKAHKKFGRLPFAKLIQPAIELAEGMPVTFALAHSLNSKRERFSRDPGSKSQFIKPDGSMWQVGDVIKQTALAATLRKIQQSYGDDFYQGSIAKSIADYFKENEGLITLNDLQSYQAKWRQPLSTKFNGYTIYSMPPPSSGGVHLLQLLNIMEHFPIKEAGANSAYETHIKTEALKHVYADRSKYLGDPDFVRVPVDELINKRYAKRIAQAINLKRAVKSSEIKPGQWLDKESPQTTHFSIMDSQGNMVSNTYTLNFSFGSGKTIPSIGMLLNNQMDDFSAKPGSPNGYGLIGGSANSIQPGKRPLSSMTPVIVLKDNQPWLATGSPGGSKIITIVFNFLLNRLVHGMNIADATITPRIHHQWLPDNLYLEPGFPVDSIKLLQQLGHSVVSRNPWGSIQSVEYANGLFMGFSDPRRPGSLAKGTNEILSVTEKEK
ncbi:gamma-glutamyltransferase [Aliikangiella sp. IMCC44653]